MAIISKPNPMLKGQDNLLTLFKSQLVNNFVVSSNVYFSDFSNWMSVNLNYQSTEGNQKKVVTFTHVDDFAPSSFYASPRARDSFSIMFIEIVDFDGEILTIPRSALNTIELDIDLTNSESDEFVILLENGAEFLLENGENLLLE